ncbi:MAG: hypothetical protein HFE83_02015 [Lachnospiraceae bacterium]|jgi:hypothetical protein|nr:hypothetical protein [Lachnospiraceae bacterium]
MLTIVYWLIILLILVLEMWEMYREPGFKNKAACALVTIPLLLRVLLIK